MITSIAGFLLFLVVPSWLAVSGLGQQDLEDDDVRIPVRIPSASNPRCQR